MEFKLQELNLTNQDTGPYGITVSDKGKVWITQHKANMISCINLDGKITEYPLPTPDAKVMCLTISSDGEVWFTENAANKIGRITKKGLLRNIHCLTQIQHPTVLQKDQMEIYGLQK